MSETPRETPLTTLAAAALVGTARGKLVQQVATRALAREQMYAVIFDLDGVPCPTWARRLPDGRAVQPIGGTPALRESFTLESPGPSTTVFPLKPGASRFYRLAVDGQYREVGCFGARGDRKTSTGLLALLGMAQRHVDIGASPPFIVFVVSATHVEHMDKLVGTLKADWWGAPVWDLRDDNRLAVATVGGKELLVLKLKGVEDSGAMNRVKGEAHAAWFEEVMPTWGFDISGGVSEQTYGIAQTSLRLPTFAHVTIVTSNYGDIGHWAWIRFGVKAPPGTVLVRVPPGESASAEDRAAWTAELADQPDLLRKLVKGEPGSLGEGPAVAEGFNVDVHVARERLRPVPGVPLVLGHDGGHTPATTILQYHNGEVRVLASLHSSRAGTRQHVEGTLRPWLALNASWALAHHGALLRNHYDPSMETGDQGDIESHPVRVLRELLGGMMRPGAVRWPARLEPMLSLFHRLNPATGRGVLQIDPECTDLILSLSGRWYYPTVQGAVSRDLPKKPNHFHEDLGDSLLYAIGGLAPLMRDDDDRRPPRQTKAASMLSTMDPTPRWPDRRNNYY
jgi:hypothetical protein